MTREEAARAAKHYAIDVFEKVLEETTLPEWEVLAAKYGVPAGEGARFASGVRQLQTQIANQLEQAKKMTGIKRGQKAPAAQAEPEAVTADS